MGKWTLKELELPLKVNWKISRGEAKTKKNLIVEYSDGEFSGEGEVSFPTGHEAQFLKEAKESFENFRSSITKEFHSLEELHTALNQIEMSSYLRVGFETAFLHFMSKLTGDDVQKLLGVNKISQIETSISIPILNEGDLEAYIKNMDVNSFQAVKVKIDKNTSHEYLKQINKYYKGFIRIDANESFENAKSVLEFCEKIQSLPIDFLEQPLAKDNWKEQKILCEESPFSLIADESITDGSIVQEVAEYFDGVNIKLAKSGGYFKAIKQLRDARDLGLKTMVGCMVETSLGISSTMNIAFGCDYFDLDGFLLLEKDPFGLVGAEKGKLFYNHLH